MFDYLQQYELLRTDVLAAIQRVLSSGQLILGPEVAAFEESFARFLGTDGGSVGVNSGTDAIAIALRALRVGPRDEVVTVANTAVPTVSAIRATGATPVFCDVDPRTCLMDLSKLGDCITGRTKAIVPVHLFGNVVDVPRVLEIIGDRDIAILEDCAQAHGARLHGRIAGTLGTVAAFSFYPTKNLGAYGDGGLCFSRDRELVRRMRSIRMYGFEESNCSEREGVNSRLDELQAAILSVKLAHLEVWVRSRRRLASRYDERLAPGIERVEPGEGVEHAYHLYVVKIEDRDAVRQKLAAEGIATGIHYRDPIHRMPAYGFLKYDQGDLPQTEALAQRILSLPMYPELSEESVDRVCEALSGAVG
jgi:aminotransferase EvaB